MSIFGIEVPGLTAGDFALLIVILFVWPAYAFINLKRNPVEKLRDDPGIRLKSYNETSIILWGMAGAVLLLWLLSGRPWSALGFQHSLDWRAAIVWLVSSIFVLYSAWQFYLVSTNEDARKKIGRQLREVGELTHLLMPKNNKEHRHAMLLGITAGITEEIIFRGYLIWVLALFVPIWLAGVLSVGIFVVLHFYQEKSGLIQVALFAAVATFLYILGGSLWPLILLHISVDIINISLARKVSTEVGY